MVQDKSIVIRMSEKKKLNQSLKKEIKMLIIRKSIYDCYRIVAPFENLVNLTLERNIIFFFVSNAQLRYYNLLFTMMLISEKMKHLIYVFIVSHNILLLLLINYYYLYSYLNYHCKLLV